MSYDQEKSAEPVEDDRITIVIPEDATTQILNTLLKSTKTVNGSSTYEVLDLIRSWRQEKERFEPAVSEDQPKPREPRVWSEAAAEPEDRPKVRDKQGDVWTYDPISGLWFTPDTTPFEWQRVVKKWGPLSEVLADSEQVTR